MPGTLINNIKTIGNFSDDDIVFFISKLESFSLGKGDHFLSEGQVCRYLAYVESGLAMYYRLHDGTEIPSDFAIENEWIGSLNSFANKNAFGYKY